METTAFELKWLKGILSNLGIDNDKPMMIHCDSQAAIHIAKNPVFHEHTKHIEVDCHFVRNEIPKIIYTQYMSRLLLSLHIYSQNH